MGQAGTGILGGDKAESAEVSYVGRVALRTVAACKMFEIRQTARLPCRKYRSLRHAMVSKGA